MVNLLKTRRAGVLLHPTSLPGRQSCGSLGRDAFRWVDWLAASGFRLWQCLPLTPVADGSPYNSYSAFAGNPHLIDIDTLSAQDLLSAPLDDTLSSDTIMRTLQQSFDRLQQQTNTPLHDALAHFRQQTLWLDDYCIFSALKEQHPGHWVNWPQPLRDREPAALADFRQHFQPRIDFHAFVQFLFDRQWRALKQHANDRGIALFGDLPIFVAHDSVDVWRHRDLFKLDAQGQPCVVAGVPPDYFSAQGQRWGNPLYDWEHHIADGFSWWQARIRHSLSLYDAVRIDHFRGFVACWEIPAGETTAINGRWVTSPGAALLNALLQIRSDLPLVAEDLGIITPDVIALRKQFKLPGMKILQFAFDSDGTNPYLPHHHSRGAVVYTGTHDNDTTLGWFQALNAEQKNRVLNYLAWPGEAMPWPLIKSALASPARWALLPLQDLLALDSTHRMNTPGTTTGNWRWRFDWTQMDERLPSYLHSLNRLYNRL